MQRSLFLLLLEIKLITIINEDCTRTPNCDTSVTGTGPYVANFIGKQFVLNFRRVRFLAERVVYKREFLFQLQCLVNSPVILF
jgi:hypothetical protein